ncbi:MAG: AEC family transporter [Oscillatoriophycideae cyanobacterium NC_groundwater_1537_Pr4_S-0.65um_50_18]|nr:AEC family transporter [Oscillatoriophycideae cyanobacterium NC_groundwater_1537_Pr4_S-0.65um_50_18]
MSGLENLLKLYATLVGWVGLGLLLGLILNHANSPLPPGLSRKIPLYLGKFLFWVGVPLSIMVFMRQANLSASVLVAPLVCWVALILGAGLAWFWIQRRSDLQLRPTQGSFLLAAMVGNTGYLGYPVTLTLAGTQYFGWAVFFDTLGSTLGAYGLGVVMAAYFGRGSQSHGELVKALVQNPALWSFFGGLGLRLVAFPPPIEAGLGVCAWVVITLSLILLGMRLSQLKSWRNVQQASMSLAIKMLIVPLALGLALPLFGITGVPLLVLVLQMAMPPAFATLVIAEAYDLDRDLTVTTLAIGSLVLLVMLPIWLWLFAPAL